MTRLQALLYLRCVAIIGQSAAILLTHFVLSMPLPLVPLFAIIAVLVGSNSYLAYRVYYHPQSVPSDDSVAIQLTVDIMALAALLYFTGGVNNPFVSLLLLPLALAAVMLPLGYLVGLVVLSVFLYASLMVNFVPLPTMPVQWQQTISLHTLAMWLNFVVSACLITGFIAYLAQKNRDTERAIANFEEIQLRQEQILALGTLAAGTAHELATPLATISVLAHDLRPQVSTHLYEDMDLLCQQIQQCKQLLNNMVQRVELAQIQEFSLLSVQQLVAKVLDKFQLLRPMIKVQYIAQPLYSHIFLACDATLEQALINLLNNAADASSAHVEIQLHQHSQQVMIDVCDKGLGLANDILNMIGQDKISTKGEQGMGIGLFLANASLERLGGEINFLARDGGGVIARVILPIHHIQHIHAALHK